MLIFGKNNKRNILLIDTYKSYIKFTFIDKKNNSCKVVSVAKTLDYLKVANPKKSIENEAIRSTLEYLAEALAKKAATEKVHLQDFHILILTHGSLSVLKNHEFFVRLKNKEEINKQKIIQLVSKEHLEEDAFSNLASHSPERRYSKSKKLISMVSPNYYNINLWEGKRVKELSFLVSQTLVLQDFKSKFEAILSELYPDSSLSFVNANIFFALAKKSNKHSENYNILDIGAEFVSFYQLYDMQVVNYKVLDKSINQIVRNLDKFVASFELAKSSLVNYLKGSCKGELCEDIKKILEEFDSHLKKEIANLQINPYLKQKITVMFNPDLDEELVLWLADRIAFHLNKKADMELDSSLYDYEKKLYSLLCIQNCHIDEKNQIIIF